MKIVLNYDLISKIKEVQENPKFSLIKHEAKFYVKWYGIYVSIELLKKHSISEALLISFVEISAVAAFLNGLRTSGSL